MVRRLVELAGSSTQRDGLADADLAGDHAEQRLGNAEADARDGFLMRGALEVLAAVGLILPGTLDFAPVLVPLAAVGLVLLMVGAIITHIRRHEAQPIVVNLALLALAGLEAGGRFGPQSFTAGRSRLRTYESGAALVLHTIGT